MLTLVKDGFTRIIDIGNVYFAIVVNTREEFLNNVTDTREALQTIKVSLTGAAAISD
jgi:hypothetical protein